MAPFAPKPGAGDTGLRGNCTADGTYGPALTLPASIEHAAHGGIIPIDSIRVGPRHRRDMGDIAGLAASIAELGLLHPVVIRPDGFLIAGERRLRAARKLGWTE